jgi:hypothetical protein
MAMVARAMATAMKRAIVRVARAMATASKRAMARAARAIGTVSKRATVTSVAGNKKGLATVARVMATATKRAMGTNGNNTGNGHGKEDDRPLMAAMMGMAQRTWLLALQLERGG